MLGLCNLIVSCINMCTNFSIWHWCAIACCCSKVKEGCKDTGAKISNSCSNAANSIKSSFTDCKDKCFNPSPEDNAPPHVELDVSGADSAFHA